MEALRFILLSLFYIAERSPLGVIISSSDHHSSLSLAWVLRFWAVAVILCCRRFDFLVLSSPCSHYSIFSSSWPNWFGVDVWALVPFYHSFPALLVSHSHFSFSSFMQKRYFSSSWLWSLIWDEEASSFAYRSQLTWWAKFISPTFWLCVNVAECCLKMGFGFSLCFSSYVNKKENGEF